MFSDSLTFFTFAPMNVFVFLSDMIFDPIGCIRAIFQDKLDSLFDTHYTLN